MFSVKNAFVSQSRRPRKGRIAIPTPRYGRRRAELTGAKYRAPHRFLSADGAGDGNRGQSDREGHCRDY